MHFVVCEETLVLVIFFNSRGWNSGILTAVVFSEYVVIST